MRSAGTLMCLASGAAFGAMAIFGKLAYDEGATVGTLLARALRARRRAVLGCSSLAGGGRPRGPRAAAPRRRASRSRSAPSATRSRPAATSPRWRASTRRCCRCCSTRSRRSSRSPRSRSAASASTRAASPRWCSPRAGSCSSSPAPGRGALDPLGAALGARRRGRLHRLHPRQRRASRERVRPQVLSALVCTGAAATLTVGSALLGEFRPAR